MFNMLFDTVEDAVKCITNACKSNPLKMGEFSVHTIDEQGTSYAPKMEYVSQVVNARTGKDPD